MGPQTERAVKLARLMPAESDHQERPAARREVAGFRSRGWRPGQLLALLGLTGFAVSQPLLAVAGEHPTLFTTAGVSGWELVVFALLVAVVPPALMWSVVVVIGLVDDRIGDVVFVGLAALLVGATGIQWSKTMIGLEHGWVLGLVAVLAATGFAVALVRVGPVAMWTRATAVLPPIAVVLLLAASPSSDLLRSRSEAPVTGDADLAPVVFIMLDELPLKSLLADDRTIDEVRFPNLAGLAADATWYRDYTVMANATLQSVPSVLTGQLPSDVEPLWTARPDNLFSLLAPTHDLNAVELVSQLCGYESCDVDGAGAGVDRGIGSVMSQMADVWRDRVSLGPFPELDLGQFAGEARPRDPDGEFEEGDADGKPTPRESNLAAPAAISAFLENLPSGPGGPASLHYLHLMLPHQPWIRYPDGGSFTGWSPADLRDHHLDGTAWNMAQLEQVHLYQAMYADRLVGEVIDHLRRTGVYDEALIVVTADHGVQFDKERYPYLRLAQPRTIDSIAYTPLFVKSPGQREGRIDDSNLMAVDVVPTIASELGVEVAWEVEGFAAGDPRIEDRSDRKEFFDFGFDGKLKEVIEFGSAERRPTTATRNVGTLMPGEHSLAAMLRTIGADGWLGVQVDDLNSSANGEQTSRAALTSFRGLGDAPGRMLGELRAAEAGDLVLMAVEGEVQSAAEVDHEGRFSLVVPQEAQGFQESDVRLFLVASDGAPVELER